MKSEAINIFDFDGTLTTETWPKFWVWVKKFGYNGDQRNNKLENALTEYRKTHNGNSLETFFGFFNDLLMEHHQTITYEDLMEGEKWIQYHPGIYDFIKKSSVKNYIVSSGLKEFLQGLKIAEHFAGIYGTPVLHNESGKIRGFGEVMTDDKKIIAIRDILKRNHRKEDDCRNVCYIGDGYSDASAMRFIHQNGGKAIFVYQPNQCDEFYHHNHNIRKMLNADGIVDFVCVADYRDGSELSNILLRQKEACKSFEDDDNK